MVITETNKPEPKPKLQIMTKNIRHLTKYFLVFVSGVSFATLIGGCDYPAEKAAVGLVSSITGIVVISTME